MLYFGIHEASLSLRRHAHGTLAKRLMHMAHFSGNTSGMSKSSSDWLIKPDLRETWVSHSFSVRQETNMPWRQTPSQKKKAVVFTNVTTNAYQGQLNAGYSKVCEIFKVRGIVFKIRPRDLHTGLLLWRHFHAPKRDAEWNELWLVVWHVGQMASWVGLGQLNRTSIPDLQPSVWRSGYARLTRGHRMGLVLPQCDSVSFLLRNVFLTSKSCFMKSHLLIFTGHRCMFRYAGNTGAKSYHLSSMT